MKRALIKNLISWKESENRLPLLLEGARQTGKTYLLEQFGQTFPACHRFDFVEDSRLHQFFEGKLTPTKLLQELAIYTGKDIQTDEDLIVFDEVQQCPRALTSLKYFAEQMPDAFVCASGSLLGISLTDELFPVGKVQRMSLRPFSFAEFLRGTGNERLADTIDGYDVREQISEPIHARLWEKLKDYFIVGGMPAAINGFKAHVETNPRKGFAAARQIHESLLKDYANDISKHSGKIKSAKISAVFKAVPLSLARETAGVKKFVFKDVGNKNPRYAELEGPIEWLLSAGLIHKISICEHAAPPVGARINERRFKLYLADVGLLGALVGITPDVIQRYDYGTYKGYFAENFVLQELLCTGLQPVSWAKNTSEVEFLLEFGERIVPVEVKSGLNAKAKSMQVFLSTYQPDTAFLLSARSVQEFSSLPNQMPMYLASCLNRLCVSGAT